MLVVLMFGLGCTGPCLASSEALTHLEAKVVMAMRAARMTVRPAPIEALRPTDLAQPLAQGDVAHRHGVQRVVALDYDPRRDLLWLTWFTKGVPGAWRVSKIPCSRDRDYIECPDLAPIIRRAAMPRRASEVDVVGALRSVEPNIERCINAYHRRSMVVRQSGTITLDLIIEPSGRWRVAAIAPRPAARSPLGRCLRAAMERLDVGRFEGEPLSLRIPVNL